MTDILMMERQHTKIKHQISYLLNNNFKNDFYPLMNNKIFSRILYVIIFAYLAIYIH